MDRSLRWRTIGLLVVVAYCALSVVPSFADKKALPSWFTEVFDRKIQLGLDLQGGLHIVYSIDLDKAVDDKASEIKRDVEAHLAETKLEGSVHTPSSLGAVTIKLTDATKKADMEKWLRSAYGDVITGRTCSDKDGEGAVCIRVSSDYADSIKKARKALRPAREAAKKKRRKG